jgi:hypothetical protein
VVDVLDLADGTRQHRGANAADRDQVRTSFRTRGGVSYR